MEHSIWFLISSAAVQQRLWFSLWLSSVVVIGALILGGGLALWEHWCRTPSATWFLALCALPLFLPPVIVGTGFIHLLGQVGDINNVLKALGLEPVQFLYTPTAVLVAHLYYNIPLAYLGLKLAFDQVSRHIEEAAQLLGASRWAQWRDVLWPQSKRALIGIGAIIFLYNLTSFALPLLLGGIQAQTLEVWLYQQIYFYHNTTAAYTIAGLQTLLLIILLGFIMRRQIVTPQQFIPQATTITVPLVLLVVRLVLAVVLLTPLLSLSLHTLWQVNWSMFVTLSQTDFFPGIGRSLILAVSVVLVAIVISLVLRGGFSWFVALLTLSPVTLGFIWLVTLGKGYLSFSLALLCGALPLVSYCIDYGLKQRPSFFIETAQWLGANRWQQYWLELGWLRPALKRAAAVGVTFVLGDVALANLLAPHQAPTGMQVALSLISNYRFALGSLAMVTMLILIGLLQLGLYVRR